MSVLEAMLAAVGAAVLIRLVLSALVKAPSPQPPDPEPIEPVQDVAVPSLDGMYAAIRLQNAAASFEQMIYAEAARQAGESSQLYRERETRA
jgi:hypothetical protein